MEENNPISQQIREFCGIQAINEWVERRTEWDEHVTRMDAERLVKISRDNIPAGRRSPGRPKLYCIVGVVIAAQCTAIFLIYIVLPRI